MKWLVLLSLIFAVPAFAQSSIDGWTDCSTAAVNVTSGDVVVNPRVGIGAQICFEFDNDHATGTSAIFVVDSSAAAVCLVQDRGGTGGAAVVALEACPGKDAVSANICAVIVTTFTDDACQAVAGGGSRYRLDVTTEVAGTENAFVHVRGY